jgi:hypothetical protein
VEFKRRTSKFEFRVDENSLTKSDYLKLLNGPDYTIEIQSIDVKVVALLAN